VLIKHFIIQLMRNIQGGPKKCTHSLLINIFGINLNEISISGWECNWFQNSRTSVISILLLYKYSSYGYKVIFSMSKCLYIFCGHSVYVEKMKIIKYSKVLQYVSDHRRSIIRESCIFAWLKITRMILSCPLSRTRSVLWQHILCACV
jgi:hypothetical protein